MILDKTRTRASSAGKGKPNQNQAITSMESHRDLLPIQTFQVHESTKFRKINDSYGQTHFTRKNPFPNLLQGLQQQAQTFSTGTSEEQNCNWKCSHGFGRLMLTLRELRYSCAPSYSPRCVFHHRTLALDTFLPQHRTRTSKPEIWPP